MTATPEQIEHYRGLVSEAEGKTIAAPDRTRQMTRGDPTSVETFVCVSCEDTVALQVPQMKWVHLRTLAYRCQATA